MPLNNAVRRPQVSHRRLSGRRGPMAGIAVLMALSLWAVAVFAHGPSMSQLNLRVDGAHIDGDWELNLRDARLALGLDTTLAGEAGWRDLEAHQDSLRTVLARSLVLTADERVVPIVFAPRPIEWQPRQNVVLLHLAMVAPVAPVRLGIRNDLLFDIDPVHRGYFMVQDSRVTHVGTLRYTVRAATAHLRQFHLGSVILEFIQAGVRHIAFRMDHVLFLVALLLPAPLLRADRAWSPRPGRAATARHVAGVLAALALAHVLGLALVLYGVVKLSWHWIEVGVALTVFIVAWNNLRPFVTWPRAAMAFAFGLVHGAGFAGALGNLTLPRRAWALALGTFDLGAELAQWALAAVLVPLLYAVSRQPWYPRRVMGVASLLIAWLAMLWVLQRAFSLSFFARG